MEYDYSIDSLIEIFQKHAVEFDKKNHPDSEIPDHMRDNFNICYAFLTFSRLIKNLSRQMEDFQIRICAIEEINKWE